MDLNHILLHLTLIDQVGPATINKIIETFTKGKLKNLPFNDIYKLSQKDLVNFCQIPDQMAFNIFDGLKDFKILEQELNLIKKYDIKLLTIFDPEYPVLLKNIYLPPVVLYIKGNFRNSQKSIAVVGSRNPDRYGYEVVEQIVPELVSAGWSIISGGALGIDSHVHKIAVESGGETIAVIGSGLLKPYPATNRDLFKNLIENNSSLMSPFNLNMAAMPGNFPARNRVIAGLSQGCLVIQAALKSGGLITAQYALEQGREVFAVPGPITSMLSAGCNKLIQDGALCATSSDDIRFALNDLTKSETKEIFSPKNFTKQVSNNPETHEEKILFLASQAVSFDELLLKTDLENNALQEILWNLQIDGKISQNFMGLWVNSRN